MRIVIIISVLILSGCSNSGIERLERNNKLSSDACIKNNGVPFFGQFGRMKECRYCGCNCFRGD